MSARREGCDRQEEGLGQNHHRFLRGPTTMAVISLWQVFDDYNEPDNPESNSLVKLEPGDSITFEIESLS